MTITTHELDANHSQTLSRLVDLQARIAELTSEAESLKAELRQLEAGEYTINGQDVLKIVPTRRFDATAAALTLSEELRSKCLTVTYDATEVKKHLTPVEVEEFMVASGKPKVVVG